MKKKKEFLIFELEVQGLQYEGQDVGALLEL